MVVLCGTDFLFLFSFKSTPDDTGYVYWFLEREEGRGGERERQLDTDINMREK